MVRQIFHVNIQTLIFSTLLVFFSSEIILRFIVKYPLTYSEKNGGFYRSRTNDLNKNIDVLLSEPHRKNVHTLEFRPNQWRDPADVEDKVFPKERYNRLGFRGLIPGRKQKFFVALGDSFTESVCVNYQNSYPKILENLLQENHINAGVLNAGLSGNDPFFDWKMLLKLNNQFPVHTAIFLLNCNHTNNVAIRGGHERFLPNGRLQYNSNTPWWEPFYAYSCLFRLIAHDIFNYNYNLHSPKLAEQLETEAVIKIKNLFENDVIPYCKKENIQLIVAMHPLIWNMGYTDPYFEFRDSLLSIPNLNFVDTYSSIFKENEIQDLYYPIDQHFNEKGYKIIAEEIADYYIENFK